jgi:hypothetical protein
MHCLKYIYLQQKNQYFFSSQLSPLHLIFLFRKCYTISILDFHFERMYYLLWSELVVRLQTSFLGAVSAVHGSQLWVLSLETNFLHWLWLDDSHGSFECKWMCSAERRLSTLGSELQFWYLLLQASMVQM